jgi:hypothetical protein
MRLVLFSIVSFVLSVDPSLSEVISNPSDTWLIPLNMEISSPGPHQDRVDHTIYRVSFECGPRAALPKRTVIDLVVLKTVTTSHSIVFSTDLVSTDPATGKGKMPDKPLRMITPFAIKGGNILDFRSPHLCPSPFVIAGSKPVYVYPVASYSTMNEPGVILEVGYGLLKLVPTLWAVFSPIPDPISKKISSSANSEDPTKSILSKFNQDKSYTSGFQIDEGRFIITTDYSQVIVTVARIPSIVKAIPSSFQEDFRTQLASAKEQIKPDDVQATCLQIATALKEVGFSEDEDIPYALTALSSKLGKREKMVDCLGQCYVESALKLGGILWSWIPKQLQLTEQYVSSIQPSTFQDAKGRIYDLVVAMSRISKGDAARKPEGLSILKLVAKDKITLVDKTPDLILARSGELNSGDIAQSFIDSQYRRFGCMTPVGDANGKGYDRAVGSFLAIKANIDVNGAEIGDALPVHVVFANGLVSELYMYNERAWAATNAKANDGNCNGFMLRNSPAPANTDHQAASQPQ